MKVRNLRKKSKWYHKHTSRFQALNKSKQAHWAKSDRNLSRYLMKRDIKTL